MLIFLIYFILSPLIYFFLVIVSIFNKKIRTVLFNKSKTLYRKKINTNKKKIVIHAASAGEYELPESIDPELANENELLQWWANEAWENGYNQEENIRYQKAVGVYQKDFF